MRPKAPLCIAKKGCGLGQSRRDSRPLRGPTPLLGHAGRRLEGGTPGDGRNKFGLRLHSALTKRAVAWGNRAGTVVPSAGQPLSSATLGGAWKVARRVTAEIIRPRAPLCIDI